MKEFDELFDKLEKNELMQSKKLIAVLADISNMCIGELTMNYKMDSQEIGAMIYEATGLTNSELNEFSFNIEGMK